MVKIAVLASFNMDLVMRTSRRPEFGETLQGEFAMFLGGKGFNQAIAARRLGAEVAVAGRVGDDEFGPRFLAALDGEGIDRRAVSVDTTAGTGVASIVVEPNGTNAIVQAPRANRNVSAADVAHARAVFAETDIAMLQLETSDAAAIAFARAMRDAGVRTLLNPAPIVPIPHGLLRLVDIIVPNQIEAEAITGTTIDDINSAFTTAEQFRDLGPACAVITLGEKGALCTGEARVYEPALDVHAVDTVGAGDAFCAALAVRLAEGADLATAMRFANAAGALACTKYGAEPSMPTRDEVEVLLAKGVPV